MSPHLPKSSQGKGEFWSSKKMGSGWHCCYRTFLAYADSGSKGVNLRMQLFPWGFSLLLQQPLMKNSAQVSPLAELYLARASFRANHYGCNAPSYLLINRGQKRSSAHSMVVYLHSQYKLKHVFSLPKPAWLPMSVPPWRMSCLCEHCLALHTQQLGDSSQQPNSSCCRGAVWQVAHGQGMAGKMGLDAEGEGV